MQLKSHIFPEIEPKILAVLNIKILSNIEIPAQTLLTAAPTSKHTFHSADRAKFAHKRNILRL